jgi:hypothetical protein
MNSEKSIILWTTIRRLRVMYNDWSSNQFQESLIQEIKALEEIINEKKKQKEDCTALEVTHQRINHWYSLTQDLENLHSLEREIAHLESVASEWYEPETILGK